jgi:hypothetical protein
MTYPVYFEVAGHWVETQIPDEMPSRPPMITSRSISKKTGLPVPLVKDVNREIKQKTGYDVMRASRGYGRLRRARWAFSTAAALALADGPLPIGDALAVGVLLGYGVYETGTAIDDFTQR